MVTLIDRILRSSKHEEQAYNSCAGVLHSCKDVPHRLVQEAARECVKPNAFKYSYFKKYFGMVQNNHSSSAINGTGKASFPYKHPWKGGIQMSSSVVITLTPQEQALVMRLKEFPCSRNGTYPGRTVEIAMQI